VRGEGTPAEVGESGWKVVNWLVEVISSDKLGESWWKLMNWSVEPISSGKVG
jgi:hypothetical protein